MPPAIPIIANATPLTHSVLRMLNNLQYLSTHAPAILFIIIIWLEAIVINNAVSTQKVFGEYNTLAALAYILLMSLINTYVFFTAPFLANIPIILCLSILFRSYNQNTAIFTFDTGFLVGIATLLYLPCAIFLPFVIIAFHMMHLFKWRKWLICFIGFFTPFILSATYFFWNDALASFYQNTIQSLSINQVLQSNTAAVINNTGILAAGVLMLIVIIIAVFQIQFQIARSIIKVKKLLKIVIYAIFFSILINIVTFSASMSALSLLSIPLSIALAFSFFVFNKKRPLLAEMYHILLLFVLFVSQYVLI